jgi:hypothetical protein
VSGPSRSSWQDFLIAGVLALLTGRALLRELHAPHARIGRANNQAGPPTGDVASMSVPQAGMPGGVHLPRPSIWPMVLAAGMTLVLFGVVTSYAFMAVGVLLTVGAVAGWIGDLLRADPD